MTLHRMSKCTNHIEQVLCLSEDTCNQLSFFLGTIESHIFGEVIRGYLPHGQVYPKDIEKATENAVQQFRRIIEAEDLRDLKLIQDLLQHYPPDALVQELDTLSKYFGRHHRDTRERVERFKMGFELVLFVPSLIDLCQALEENDLHEPNLLREAREICDRVQYTSNLRERDRGDRDRVVTYTEASHILKNLGGLLIGLDRFHMDYFRVFFIFFYTLFYFRLYLKLVG